MCIRDSRDTRLSGRGRFWKFAYIIESWKLARVMRHFSKNQFWMKILDSQKISKPALYTMFLICNSFFDCTLTICNDRLFPKSAQYRQTCVAENSKICHISLNKIRWVILIRFLRIKNFHQKWIFWKITENSQETY